MIAAATPRIGLLQAIDDPRLLGAGIALFPKQREILDALDQGPWRTLIAACGRRGGKTHLAAVATVHNALFRPDLDALVRPGEWRYAVTIATNREQAKICLRIAEDLIDASPLLRGRVLERRDDQILVETLTGGRAVIAAFPCTSRGLRGRPISLLVLDEAAHHVDSDGNASDRAVMTAAIPSIAQFGQLGRVLMISTPWGTANSFATEHARAVSGEEPTSRAWTLTSFELNPTLDPADFESEQRRDPDTYRSEYLAEFVGGMGAFFDRDRLTVVGGVDHPVDACERWVGGLDPAFQRDPFGVAVVGRARADRSRLLIGAVEALKPPPATSFEDRSRVTDELLDAVAAVLKRFEVRAAQTDQYAGRAVADRLRDEGIAAQVVATTGTSQHEQFIALRAELYEGRLVLPDDPGFLAELMMVRVKHGDGGPRILLPRTATHHCDRAAALTQAVWMLVRHGRPAVGREGRREFGRSTFGRMLDRDPVTFRAPRLRRWDA